MGADSQETKGAPPEAKFVASVFGRVYYPVEADAFRHLPETELRWFPTERAARVAGYRPAMPVEPGLEEFEIIGQIGRGGTSTVFHAYDPVLRREVAIKVMHRADGADEESLARFSREARLVARLQHPRVVSVFAVKKLTGGGLALIMEYVPGQTLRDLIKSEGPLPLEQVESILRDVGEALAAAHAQGIIHRDIKPENIFIQATTGHALLADFGVAVPLDDTTRITHTGQVIGTPAYMAPELFDGGALEASSDLYSLGLVAWEMLAGRSPWAGENIYTIIRKQKEEQLPSLRKLRPELPKRVHVAINRALAKDPQDRWENVAEFLARFSGEASSLWWLWRPLERFRSGSASAPRLEGTGGEIEQAASAPTVQLSVGGDGELPEVVRVERGDASAAPVAAVAGGTVAAADRVADVPRPPRVALRTAGPAPRRRRSARTRSLPRVAAGIVFLTTAAVAAAAATSWLQRDAATDEAPMIVVSAESEDATSPGESAGTGNPADLAPYPGLDPADSLAAEEMVVDTASFLDAIPDFLMSSPAPAEEPEEVVEDTAVVEEPEVEVEAVEEPVLRLEQTASRIAPGGLHTCAVGSDGALLCWGSNERGQLGQGAGARSSAPGVIDLGITARSVVAGAFHTCALDTQGRPYCWGDNREGQLGGGVRGSDRGSVPASSQRFASLALGSSHSCGLTPDGRVYCWGSNSYGQLGSAGPGASAPLLVQSPETFVSIAAGWNHTCALTPQGRAYCWGRNDSGQLGDGTNTSTSLPAPVEGEQRFRMLTAGSAHTCGLTLDGEAYCWGQGNDGLLGNGANNSSAVPVRVLASQRFTQISAGGRHTCAVAQDGSAYCWGQNNYGQLGDETTAARAAPVQVRAPVGLTAVFASGSHSCGLGTDGEAYCWGFNIEGQLGDGSFAHRTTPQRVESLPGGLR